MAYCPNCGKELESSGAFCGYCGAPTAAAPTAASATATPTAAPAEASPATAATATSSVVTPTTAATTPTPETNQVPAPNPAAVPSPAPNPNQTAAPIYAPASIPAYTDPSDHTNEFTPEEIQEGKLFGMICYLLGILGIIVALLAKKENGFVQFHVHQALKLTVIEACAGIIAALLFWTLLVPLAVGIFCIVLFVLEIMGFFQAAKGTAKDLPIVKKFNF